MPAGLKYEEGGEWEIVLGQIGRGMGIPIDNIQYEHKLNMNVSSR
jgi:hypothetical protein